MPDSILTRVRSLLKDKNRSCYLIFLTTSMSLRRKRSCSKASVIWVACPLWKSLIEAFQGTATPSTFSWGDQARCRMRTSALVCSSWLSTEVNLLSRGSLATFYCLVPFWGPASPFSSSWIALFFFRSRMTFSLRSVGGGGGGNVSGT